MTGQRPVVIGYVAGSTEKETARQRADVASYADAEGLAVADVLEDTRDGLTISQVTEVARNHGASVVVVPASARLAEAYTRLAYELERHGVRCALLGTLQSKSRHRDALAALGSRS